MTGTQHDAYGEELARISRHQGEAVNARLRLFEVLAAAGVPAAEADVLVSRLEAGAVAGAHTWVSESSALHGSQQPFEDGWFAGVRAVSSYLLRIADDAAAQRGRAASSAELRAHLREPAGRVPQPAAPPAAPAGSALDPAEVLAAALRCTWALTTPDQFFTTEASSEILTVALSAVREEEHDGYVQRLEAFAHRHRERLEKLLRTHGPGSAPAAHGRYALVGQPETLVVCERMETARLLLYGLWEGELEDVLLDDLAYVWGVRRPTR
ncbi:hypothetical protein [Streptomyces sp. NPDC008317]|uniref:hypothetical protein n=1 Tax=Streptomyces sp. NPDC008317 TaxID=3364827 RepID=UPI0036EB9C9B